MSALLALPGKTIDLTEVGELLLALQSELAEEPLVDRFERLLAKPRA